MNCALELIAIKEIATKEWEMEEEIKNAEARETYKMWCNDTIYLCDTEINDKLVDKALNRQPLSISYKIRIEKDRLNNSIFRFVTKDSYTYANGDDSYTAKGSYYSLDTLKNYLADHCITMDMYEDSYKSYGCGSLKCNRIVIYVPKN